MNDKLALHFKANEFERTKQFDNYFTTDLITRNNAGASTTYFEKSFRNAEKYNADISNKGLLISFNPNKINNRVYNFENLPYSDFLHSVNEIEEEINQSGIDVKFNNGKIVRYDNSFDIQTKYPYSEYSPLLKTLVPNNKAIRQARKRIYEGTVYFGNKSSETTIYNKTLESNLNIDVIRFEHKHLKLPKDNKPLLKNITENEYYQRRKKDKNRIGIQLFITKPEILENKHLEYFAYLLKEGFSNSNINKLFAYNCIRNEGLETVLDLLTVPKKDKYYQKNSRYRKDLISSLVLSSDFLPLYNELEQLFRKAE